jgi:apolipoprotein D and lipocalin family protein
MRLLSVFISLLLLTACANSGTGQAPPQTVGKVDLERYQGTWYELARLPMFFQRDCLQSEAHYTLKSADEVGVLNRCRDNKGEWQEVHGTATPQVKGSTDKLTVAFTESKLLSALARGEYWIIYLDDDYENAVVGDSSLSYLWLLSRKPNVDQDALNKMLLAARKQGYDTEKLIWRTPDEAMPNAQ